MRAFSGNAHLAGGALISTRWVVTSADRIAGMATNSLNLALGTINLASGFTQRRSDRLNVHPEFNRTNLNNK